MTDPLRRHVRPALAEAMSDVTAVPDAAASGHLAATGATAMFPDGSNSPSAVGDRRHAACPCGATATTRVEVTWADGKRRYRYCETCADDVVYAIEGAEVVP